MNRHPKYAEALRVCKGGTEEAGRMFQMYLQLTEVRGWWDVRMHAGRGDGPAFLSGCPTCHSQRSAIVPISADASTTVPDLHRLQQSIELEDGSKPDKVTLAPLETDSTFAVYSIAEGLVPPETQEVQEAWKRRAVGRYGRRARHVNLQTQRYHAMKAVAEEEL